MICSKLRLSAVVAANAAKMSSVATAAATATATPVQDNVAPTCPLKNVPKDEQLDVNVVRDLLRNPVALAHCPFAQRAAASSSVQAALSQQPQQQATAIDDAEPAVAPIVELQQPATTTSVPYHATKFFEAKLQQLKELRHYRTFRYLRRYVVAFFSCFVFLAWSSAFFPFW